LLVHGHKYTLQALHGHKYTLQALHGHKYTLQALHGHKYTLQASSEIAAPGHEEQGLPAFTHERFCLRLPPPQDFEQSDQDDHGLHA